MQREKHTIESREKWLELRANDITSTEIAALFDCSPFEEMTRFGLWHRKRNKEVVSIDQNERMKWGTRLESAIANGVAEDLGYTAKRIDYYQRIPELRIGSSFDYMLMSGDQELSLLECKNVDWRRFKDGWIILDDDDIEAPPHIELQVQHQLLVSGMEKAVIGVLVGGNAAKPIHRVAMPYVQEQIIRRVAGFWESIERGIEPTPDFTKDADLISRLNQYAEPGKVLQVGDSAEYAELANEYNAAMAMSKHAEMKKKEIKAKLFTLAGDHEKITGDFGSFNIGLVPPAEIAAHTRAGYRNIRLFTKKENQNA